MPLISVNSCVNAALLVEIMLLLSSERVITVIADMSRSQGFQRSDESVGRKVASLYKCYSCMNMEIYEYWSSVEHTYNLPTNFTDSCLSTPSKSNIGFVSCDTACIVIKEQRFAGGSSEGYNVVRGCLSTITKFPLPSDVIGLSRRSLSSRSLCHMIEAEHLYPNYHIAAKKPPVVTGRGEAKPSARFLVTICTCYGHLCNSDSISAAYSENRIILVPLLVCISMSLISILMSPLFVV